MSGMNVHELNEFIKAIRDIERLNAENEKLNARISELEKGK